MKQNIPRIYIKDHFYINKIFDLSIDYVHYIINVLRMNIKDILEIFNNTNYIFIAQIVYIKKKKIILKILSSHFKNIESPINIHLGQVISRNEKMNFTIQKSIEMGVNIITPLFSKSCNIQKKWMNIEKKITHWKKIAISTCQQCHRNVIPTINHPENILSWCEKNQKDNIKIIFHPNATLTMNHLPQLIKPIKIIIGSEIGFSDHEVQNIMQYGFIPINLGPRILRTETTSIAAITALQIKFGDFNI